MDQQKKIADHEFFSDDFIEKRETNLDFILSLANVSSRGKQMLLRDLTRMEEQHSEEEESEQDDILEK